MITPTHSLSSLTTATAAGCTRTTVPFLEAVASSAPASSQAIAACSRAQHSTARYSREW